MELRYSKSRRWLGLRVAHTSAGVTLCGALALASGCAVGMRHATLADGFAAAMRGDGRAALEIYDSVARQHPDTMQGALAIDAMIELTGNRLFPEPSYECSPAAKAKYSEAEEQFQADSMDAALAAYQAAVELCPNNATWWIHSGDAYFGMGEYEQAKALYVRGLQIDPWNRGGHRFLADAEAHLGNAGETYRSAVLAVVSDPTYEAGWQTLKQVTSRLGGQWNRRLERKPHIGEENGKPVVVLDPTYESKASLTAWLLYGLLRLQFSQGPSADGKKAGEGTPATRLSQKEWNQMSPLERERFLVSESLEVYVKFTSDTPATTAVIWETFRKASQADFLNEAIYMHLVDRELAPSYRAYRAAHTERLIEYLTRIVAPVPPFGGRKA